MFLGSASAGTGMIICVIVTQNVTQANAYTRTVTYLRALHPTLTWPPVLLVSFWLSTTRLQGREVPYGMSGRCEECGACTIWDPDVGSAICVECGTLADPTQSVLSSHLDVVDTSGREFAPWSNVPGGNTIRGRNGWALGGQDKESRDRRNTVSIPLLPVCVGLIRYTAHYARIHTYLR